MPAGQKTNIFLKGDVNIFSVLRFTYLFHIFECYSKKYMSFVLQLANKIIILNLF